MATYTTNLNLAKPGMNDNIDVTVINSNMDILDSAVSSAGKAPVLEVNCGTVTALPHTVENAKIKANMICIDSFLGSVLAQRETWKVTTSDGSLTVSAQEGSSHDERALIGSTSLTLYLVERRV